MAKVPNEFKEFYEEINKLTQKYSDITFLVIATPDDNPFSTLFAGNYCKLCAFDIFGTYLLSRPNLKHDSDE